MSNRPNNSPEFGYRSLKERIRERLIIELEGTLNTASVEEMQMFDQLFGEVLAEENVVLARQERQRLFDELVEDISTLSRRW